MSTMSRVRKVEPCVPLKSVSLWMPLYSVEGISPTCHENNTTECVFQTENVSEMFNFTKYMIRFCSHLLRLRQSVLHFQQCLWTTERRNCVAFHFSGKSAIKECTNKIKKIKIHAG